MSSEDKVLVDIPLGWYHHFSASSLCRFPRLAVLTYCFNVSWRRKRTERRSTNITRCMERIFTCKTFKPMPYAKGVKMSYWSLQRMCCQRRSCWMRNWPKKSREHTLFFSVSVMKHSPYDARQEAIWCYGKLSGWRYLQVGYNLCSI